MRKEKQILESVKRDLKRFEDSLHPIPPPQQDRQSLLPSPATQSRGKGDTSHQKKLPNSANRSSLVLEASTQAEHHGEDEAAVQDGDGMREGEEEIGAECSNEDEQVNSGSERDSSSEASLLHDAATPLNDVEHVSEGDELQVRKRKSKPKTRKLIQKTRTVAGIRKHGKNLLPPSKARASSSSTHPLITARSPRRLPTPPSTPLFKSAILGEISEIRTMVKNLQVRGSMAANCLQSLRGGWGRAL